MEKSPEITRVPSTEEIAAERGREPVTPNTGPVYELPEVETGQTRPVDPDSDLGERRHITIVRDAQQPRS